MWCEVPLVTQRLEHQEKMVRRHSRIVSLRFSILFLASQMVRWSDGPMRPMVLWSDEADEADGALFAYRGLAMGHANFRCMGESGYFCS
jgi:hypothetical protein